MHGIQEILGAELGGWVRVERTIDGDHVREAGVSVTIYNRAPLELRFIGLEIERPGDVCFARSETSFIAHGERTPSRIFRTGKLLKPYPGGGADFPSARITAPFVVPQETAEVRIKPLIAARSAWIRSMPTRVRLTLSNRR